MIYARIVRLDFQSAKERLARRICVYAIADTITYFGDKQKKNAGLQPQIESIQSMAFLACSHIVPDYLNCICYSEDLYVWSGSYSAILLHFIVHVGP